MKADAEPESPPARPDRHRLLVWFVAHARWGWPLLVVGAVLVASWSDLRGIHYQEVRRALYSLTPHGLALAALLTVANLAIMGLYDVICLQGTNVRVRERWWIGSLAFAWSNFLTLGPLAGPAIRFWLYRPAGVEFATLRQAIVSIAVGFGTGLFVWTAASAIPFPGTGWSSIGLTAVAVFLLTCFGGLLVARVQRWKRWPEWVRELKVRWSALLMLGALDWLLAFLVFRVVLSSGDIPIASPVAARVFFLGQGIGLLSLVPGGLGSADAFWLSRLGAHGGQGPAVLVAYRAVYYLLPWAAANLLLLRRAVHLKVRWAEPARLFVALITALSGSIVLVSAATPTLTHRLKILERILPLPILETSHLATAVSGLLLLVVARGLMKGYRDAYRTTLTLLLAGAIASVLKGLDYEEAIVLFLTASLLWTHSKLFSLPSRPGGTAVAILTPIAMALFAFAALGLSSYGHVPFSGDLWFTFAHSAEAARFVRALSVLLLVGLLVAIDFTLRRPHHHVPPTEDEVRRALALHEKVGKGTTPLLLLTGDKSIHFWEAEGFCLYRAVGSCLVVFSDPSIPAGMERPFLESLLQRAAELDRTLLFYQVSSRWIPVLHDFGYFFFKLGEEAIVDLERFNIRGNKGKAMRNVLNRFRNDGYEFQVMPAEEVCPHLTALRSISDEWLRSKKTRERQFSMGFFDEKYLCAFPCAVVRDRTGRPVAFANVLLGPNSEELSVDLMRYLPECPNGVMDLLFLSLFDWGREQGYRSFNLGMAPLSTVGAVRQARLGERLANLVFQHGEHWYNFRGLRLFKEKYDPRWEPRYLAYPALWMWPQAVAHVSALIAGGYRKVVFPAAQRSDLTRRVFPGRRSTWAAHGVARGTLPSPWQSR